MVRVIALAAALLITAAACGGTPDDVAAPPAAPSASQPSETAEKPNKSDKDDENAKKAVPAKLKFTSKDLDGASFDGESLAGKPVVLWFWAPWCPKCAAEAPAVKQAAAEHGDSVAFLGVPGLSQKPAMKQFVSRHGLGGFPHLPDAELWKRFRIAQQSTFVFMKADGSTTNASGPLSDEDLAQHIRQIMKSEDES